jgi:hypothetical protein
MIMLIKFFTFHCFVHWNLFNIYMYDIEEKLHRQSIKKFP